MENHLPKCQKVGDMLVPRREKKVIANHLTQKPPANNRVKTHFRPGGEES